MISQVVTPDFTIKIDFRRSTGAFRS